MSKTLESAMTTIRRARIYAESINGSEVHVIPFRGVGIKTWGAIDYLRKHHKLTFLRER